MKIDTTELYESIATLERIFNVERDTERADTFDNFDRQDEAYEDRRQRDDDEREQRLHEALDAAKDAGVDVEHLKVLAFEAGATHWALANSLKG